MLSFFKKFFGSKPTVSPCSDVPYKVEAPVASVPPSTTVPSFPAETVKKKSSGEKKPAAKPKTAKAKKPKTASKKQ